MSFLSELVPAIGNAWCSIINDPAAFSALLTPGVGAIPPLRNSLAGAASRLFCNREPPPNPLAIVGGQCATDYRVIFSVYCEFSNGQENPNCSGFPLQISPVLGPLRGTEVVPEGNFQALYLLAAPTPSRPDGRYRVTGFGDSSSQNFRVTNIAIVRLDGLPDNCGNAPIPRPNPPSSGYNRTNIDITYIDANDNSVTVPVNIVFAPVVVNANGTLNVPFQINVNPEVNVPVNGTLNINTGDVSINFGNQEYLPNECEPDGGDYESDPNIPEPPSDVPDAEDGPAPDEPSDETTRVVRGVIVTVGGSDGGVTTVFQDSNPDIYVPRVGNVAFLCDVNGKRAWTNDIPVRGKRVLIECPWIGGARDVKGTPSPGVEWVLTPVYSRSNQAISFES